MHNTFFISDTHFGHTKSLTFTRKDGTLLRPGFSCVEEMDEHMVDCWNKVVRPCDKVYHLGDVVINRKSLSILKRLNGKKRLVRGNHDIFRTSDFLEYFDEIYGIRVFSKEGFVATHVPIHTSSLERWKLNVHGHLHSNVVENLHMMIDGTIQTVPDSRYMCVSVEQVEYTPVHLDVVLDKIAYLGGEVY